LDVLGAGVRHEKIAALIELARHLAGSAEGLTLDEMAQAAGVGRRTAERMRDTLMMLFPHMDEVADPPTKRFRIAGGLDGFAQTPTTTELLELSKAAATLRASDAGLRAAVLEGLERKIRSAMRSSALRRLAPDVEALVRAETIAVQAGPRPFEDEGVIATLRHALTAMKMVSFSYRGGRTPGLVRTVVPYGLMFSRMNYLVAAEQGSGVPRNWRLDRIADLAALETPASPPPDFSLQDYAARSFGIFQDELQDVVLRILPEGAEDALGWRFHPNQVVEAMEDGSVLVRFTVSGMLELSWHLFTWGDKLQVLEPAILRETLVEQLELALARHRPASKSDVTAP
jgi:predicted DNA-binding transcriptional regulator YafY